MKKYNLFDVFYIDEKKVNIWYDNIEKKHKRPYIMIHKNDKYAIFMPCMSKWYLGEFDGKKMKRIKANDWIEIILITRNKKTNEKEKIDNYLLTDRVLIYSNGKLNWLISNKVIFPYPITPLDVKRNVVNLKSFREKFIKIFN